MNREIVRSNIEVPDFSAIVSGLREMPQGVSGPAPRDMREYADPEAVWGMADLEGRRLDDYTGLLDSVTQTVNKYASRKGIEPSSDLNREIADKVSLVAKAIGFDEERPILSKTERIAVARLVLNYSEEEVERYLGDGFIADMIQEASASEEIANHVGRFFGRWERLRRVTVNRDAYEASRGSVRLAAEIATDRRQYLKELGVDEPDDRFVAALSPYNLLTLATLSPENSSAVLAKASHLFDEVAEKFPLLVENMAEDTVRTIFRRGGSDSKSGFSKESLFKFLSRREVALRAAGSEYAAAYLVGGKTDEDITARAKTMQARNRFTRSNGLRGSVAEKIPGKHFRSALYGHDFGDTLIDISQKVSTEQSERIFDKIDTIRERIKEYANMFNGIDTTFARATEEALNQRITDVLVAFREVAVNGSLHEDVAPYRGNEGYIHDGRFDIDVESIEDALGIIDGLEKTFSTMHAVITAEDLRINKVNEPDKQFVVYRFMSKQVGNMLVYVRPEGAYGYDKQMEYGNAKGVEASISFIVNPLDPHKLLTPKDSDAVSIRFDHEGRLVDEAPDSNRRDPTRKDGLISVDVSSGMGRADSLPVRIGRFIAAGNRIRARREGTEDSLHHNTNYFDQEKYGDSDGFAHLARSVIRQVELIRRTRNGRVFGKAVQLTAKTTDAKQADVLEVA